MGWRPTGTTTASDPLVGANNAATQNPAFNERGEPLLAEATDNPTIVLSAARANDPSLREPGYPAYLPGIKIVGEDTAQPSMAARDVVEAKPSRSITFEDNDISSYLTDDPYEGLSFEHNVLGLRTEQARADDIIAEGDRLFARLPAIDATADRLLLDTLSESFTALVNDPIGEVSRSFRSYYNSMNQAANTLFGTGEIFLSGIYNGAVEVVGGAASVPYVFDSVDAAVAVQAGFSDRYSYDLRSDGAQWVVEDVFAPAGTFINDNILQPSRTFSENLMGDGVTTALFAGVNAGVQIAGVLTGTKGLSAAFKQVDAPNNINLGPASGVDGKLAAESGAVSRESTIRALRANGSPEALATVALIKRNRVNLNLLPSDPAGAAGRQPFFTNNVDLFLDKINSPSQAAGIAAHETKHFLQKLTPTKYMMDALRFELEAYKWQRIVDPKFPLNTDSAVTEYLKKSVLYPTIR